MDGHAIPALIDDLSRKRDFLRVLARIDAENARYGRCQRREDEAVVLDELIEHLRRRAEALARNVYDGAISCWSCGRPVRGGDLICTPCTLDLAPGAGTEPRVDLR